MATHRRKVPADPNLALRIETFRRKRHLSVTKLAAAVGVKPSAVSHWIVGRYEPRRENIARLAEALGVSVERLMGADLTPEQRETERRYLQVILRGGPRLAELIESITADELVDVLERHAVAKSHPEPKHRPPRR
jgi:transcriptional regulator with XRE-family HTH domain